jgi:hypothetical protein
MSNKSVKTKSNQEFSREAQVKKARKEHTCCSCKKTIPKSSSYIRTVGVCESMSYNGNEFFSNAWHPACLDDHQGYVRDSLRRQG